MQFSHLKCTKENVFVFEDGVPLRVGSAIRRRLILHKVCIVRDLQIPAILLHVYIHDYTHVQMRLRAYAHDQHLHARDTDIQIQVTKKSLILAHF